LGVNNLIVSIIFNAGQIKNGHQHHSNRQPNGNILKHVVQNSVPYINNNTCDLLVAYTKI
jgi:hypothetical protein